MVDNEEPTQTRYCLGIFGAVCGWITHMQEATVWSIAISGIVILLLPLIIKGLLEIVLRIVETLMWIMVW